MVRNIINIVYRFKILSIVRYWWENGIIYLASQFFEAPRSSHGVPNFKVARGVSDSIVSYSTRTRGTTNTYFIILLYVLKLEIALR